MKTILIAMLTTLTMACSDSIFCDCDEEKELELVTIEDEEVCAFGHDGLPSLKHTFEGFPDFEVYECIWGHKFFVKRN